MAIRLDKEDVGPKYYYRKNGVVFGPMRLDNLLQQADKNTQVSKDAKTWVDFSELPEIKSRIKPVPPPQRPTTPTAPKQRNNSWIFLLIIPIALYYVYKKQEQNKTASPEPIEVISEDSLAVEVDTAAVASSEDIYFSVLSAKYIEPSLLQSLTFNDLSLYRNTLLARHGCIFTDTAAKRIFSATDWYTPQRNEFEAVNDFSPVEDNNYRTINQEYTTRLAAITNLIESYYRAIENNEFDASMYYANTVSAYINKKNLSAWEVGEIIQASYEEFQQPDYSFVLPIAVSSGEQRDGIDFITFPTQYKVFRKSKGQYQTCEVLMQWGLDKNLKIVSYRELSIKNLKYSTPADLGTDSSE